MSLQKKKKTPVAKPNNVTSQWIAFYIVTTIKFSNTTQCGEFTQCIISYSGLGSSIGIATDYGLDGPGSNPGGEKFSARPNQPWGPPSLL